MLNPSTWRLIGVLGSVVFLAACSESESESISGENSADAAGGGDGQADVGAADQQSNDASGDVVGEDDAGVDAPDASDRPDVLEDVHVSEAGDGSMDDGGKDAGHPETGEKLTPSCEAAEGVLCTTARWAVCPVGYEPVDQGDGHLGCGHTGWCCQVAPPSTCSDATLYNCVPGECKGCWESSEDPLLTCEKGRSCCRDYCK